MAVALLAAAALVTPAAADDTQLPVEMEVAEGSLSVEWNDLAPLTMQVALDDDLRYVNELVLPWLTVTDTRADSTGYTVGLLMAPLTSNTDVLPAAASTIHLAGPTAPQVAPLTFAEVTPALTATSGVDLRDGAPLGSASAIDGLGRVAWSPGTMTVDIAANAANPVLPGLYTSTITVQVVAGPVG